MKDKLPLCDLWPHPNRRAHDDAKRLAAHAVSTALRTGALIRQPCEVCGRQASEAHHEDYNLPLQVRWLCRPHHRKRDVQLAIKRRMGLLEETIRVEIRTRQNEARLSNDVALSLVFDATAQLDDERRRAGLSYYALATKAGASRQAATSWFGGGVRTLKALANIASALGCDVQIQLVPRDGQSSRVA